MVDSPINFVYLYGIAQKPERNVLNNRVINATTLLDRKLFALSIFPIEK